jgi:glycosyltransferase involved in cell wall biosynthesis
MPRVVVAVPVHDGERFLATALASIAAQTYADWEAIVVDDASGDGGPDIAAGFAGRDPRFRLIRLERNAGVAAARNAAIRASAGTELVALLDQDDAWAPGYLARSVALFDAARTAGRRPGIVACNARLSTADGMLAETFAERFGWTDRIDLDAMIARNCVLARALFSRAAFEAVGGFAPECGAADDYDLWLRMLEAGYEVIATREPLVTYRLHAAAQSRDLGRMAESNLVAYRRALARGTLSPRQRRALRSRVRHHRALRERARVRAALAGRRPVRAGALALRAAPHGLVAFLQAPGRWGEWARGALRAASPARPRRPRDTTR